MSRQRLKLIESDGEVVSPSDPGYVPSLSEAAPEYGALLKRRDELKALIRRLEAELATTTDAESESAAHEERVVALLEGRPVPKKNQSDRQATKSELAAARSAMAIARSGFPQLSMPPVGKFESRSACTIALSCSSLLRRRSGCIKRICGIATSPIV
jgi:hypothetical protein